MEQMKTFSSARTGLTQVSCLLSALLLGGFSIMMITSSIEFLFMGSLFLLFSLGMGYISLNLYSLKMYKGDLEFTNLFGKKIEMHIDDVLVYNTNQFSIALIDPLALNRIAIIKYKTGTEYKKVVVMTPSRLSNYCDIEQLLLDSKKKNTRQQVAA